ncbi:MAG: hypothetical protein KIT31_27830 [Deltaproteobacteria bacterium]|nr:hypothetical protein [Deltaproteobacteria bacterium]
MSAVAPATPPRDVAAGDARILSQSPLGGVLVLDGDRHRARARAEVVMEGHCAGLYTIVQEGEETVTIDERPVTQWRVHYVCVRDT